MLRYYCSPFYVHSALHPVLDQLERSAGLKKTDPPEVKLDKLEALLGQGCREVTRATALLAPLLSIPTGQRYPPLEVAPERKKSLMLEALLEQLAGMAARPLLILLEDAHWIDPTSTELFQLIIERIQRLPVLLIIAFRPNFTPPWTGFPHITALSLSHLSHRQAAALVDKVTRGRQLPREVLDHIVKRTDGVPLYVEELTKTLLESGALEPAGNGFRLTGPLPLLSIPESLHNSLMARLDRLAGVKDVAHLAATLGRVFSHELLAAVSPLDETLLRKALDQLIDAELIYQRGAPPDIDLRVQARAGAGCRLQQPLAQQAPAAPPADRQTLEERFRRDHRDHARAARLPLPRRSAAGQGVPLCDACRRRRRCAATPRPRRAPASRRRSTRRARCRRRRMPRGRRSRRSSSSPASPRTGSTSSRTCATSSRCSRSRRRSTTANRCVGSSIGWAGSTTCSAASTARSSWPARRC